MTVRIDAVDRLDPILGWVRKCSKCREFVQHGEFHKHRRDHMGIQRMCRRCTRNRPRSHHPRPTSDQYRIQYSNHREKVIAYSRAHYRTVRGRLLTLISAARSRSRKQGWVHDLDIDWALTLWEKQGGRCVVTGIPLEIDIPLRTKEKYLNPFAPSLDRIDCSGGYTKDNTRIVCVAINLALNRFGTGVLEKLLVGFAGRLAQAG